MTARALLIVSLVAVTVAPAITQQAPNPETLAEMRKVSADPGIDGRFGERITGSYVFQPQRPDWPQLPVVNPQAIGPLAVGPLIRARGAIDDAGRISVGGVGLPPPPEQPEFIRTLTSPFRKFLELSVGKGASKEDPKPWALEMPKDKEEARAAIKKILDGYKNAIDSNNPSERNQIVAAWDQLRSTYIDIYHDSQDAKAIYGDIDNYPHWRYQRIYDQAPSVVAIGEPGASKSICSGSVIAPDLVLTALHCFSDPNKKLPAQLEAWIGYFDTGVPGKVATIMRRKIVDLVAPTMAELVAVRLGKAVPNLLDYAIVRITPPTKEEPSPSQLCLRQYDMHRGEAVYLLGYPQGNALTVHDSARIYLPFRVTDGDEFLRLRLDVEADVRLFQDGANLITQFVKSYQPVVIAQQPTRELHHVRDNGEPRAGIVADTFEGNSGGPMFDHERDQCVAGILIAGASDSGLRRRPNWKEHERVLPMTAILEDLNRRQLSSVTGQLKVP